MGALSRRRLSGHCERTFLSSRFLFRAHMRHVGPGSLRLDESYDRSVRLASGSPLRGCCSACATRGVRHPGTRSTAGRRRLFTHSRSVHATSLIHSGRFRNLFRQGPILSPCLPLAADMTMVIIGTGSKWSLVVFARHTWSEWCNAAVKSPSIRRDSRGPCPTSRAWCV